MIDCLLGCVLLTIGFFLGVIMTEDSIYKRGQVDAINGIVKYELVVAENNSTYWKRIKD